MYEYRVRIDRVVDGDTVDVDIDLGFGVWLKGERVRIVGIDTPESRTRDLVEKTFGYAAKDFVEEFLDKEATLICNTYDAKGKFGRILGDFEVNDVSLSEALVENHHAVPYWGGSKDEVEKQHLENRKILIEKGVVCLD